MNFIDTQEPLFIRCADGTNASLIEWNKPLSQNHSYEWAHNAADQIFDDIRLPVDDVRVAEAGRMFLDRGAIDWNHIFVSSTGARVHNDPKRDISLG